MLVGASAENSFPSLEKLPPLEDVREDHCVEMAHMGGYLMVSFSALFEFHAANIPALT